MAQNDIKGSKLIVIQLQCTQREIVLQLWQHRKITIQAYCTQDKQYRRETFAQSIMTMSQYKEKYIQKRRHHTNYYSQLENPHPCFKYLSNMIMYSTFCHHPQGMQTHVQSCLSFLCRPFHAVQPKQGIEIHWNRENKLHLTMGVLSYQYLTDWCNAHLFQAFFPFQIPKWFHTKNLKKS